VTLGLAALLLLAGCAHLAPAGNEDTDVRLECRRAADGASPSRYTGKWREAYEKCLDEKGVRTE